ncbi:MAG: nicotinate (nicotinamide) nucleotide adenylyltransferase [candidate division Zixibacteria bacterium]|nr:nicotinate (nicotinamide) nucleotide adenylyltransferase [candidate division Zixibacteria bacterium]
MPRQGTRNNPSQGSVWGIMGGSFNPIHVGHLIMAESVMYSRQAAGMLFVPAGNHPLKADRQMADYADRVAMVRTALRGNPGFRLEEPPPGPGYTLDLIDCLRSRYPAADFFLAVGADIVEEFSSWYKYEELARCVRIAIAARPGYRFPPPGTGPLGAAERIIIPQIDISSSDIRRRVQSHLSIRYLVPDGVRKIIETRRLYVE